MSVEALYALGAVSVAALLASGAYLWRLLRGVPLGRRLADLLMPASQIALVACVFALRSYFAHWETIALAVVPMGIVAAILNPLFFKGLLGAERAEAEARRVAFLEDQLSTQRQYAALMQRTREEAAHVRVALDALLARIGKALAAGDAETVRSRIAAAEQALRLPQRRYCQHPVADALLSAKAAWCDRERIPLEVDAAVPSDLPTPDVELCALFANALDNAIHACLQLPETDRWLRVKAHPAHGYFLLEVENSCVAEGEPAVRRQAARMRQSGLPRHGHGMGIMREIVGRHDGELACRREGGAFLLSMIWKL